MTIEDLGNFGDLIAAIATIATLAYLARQIRQSSKSVEGSTAQSLLDLEVSTFALIAQHAGIYHRGRESIEDLSPEEKIVFEQLVSAVMSLMVSAFIQFQNGLLASYDPFLSDWKMSSSTSLGFNRCGQKSEAATRKIFANVSMKWARPSRAPPDNALHLSQVSLNVRDLKDRY